MGGRRRSLIWRVGLMGFEEAIEGVSERAFQEDVEERDEEGEPCWHSSSLAKFSCYLGMPTEGFEGEILFLLKRMKERKLQKGKLNGRKKKKLESSKFERELRKLEWTVNYLGGGGGEGGETKIQEVSRGIIRSLGVGRFLEWGAVDSRGAAGGVYGPTTRRDRECFWEELGAINGLWNGPWCVARDFNTILSPKERGRGGSLNSNMRRFSEVIEDLQLKDLPLVGGLFTWNGGVNNQPFSRLDRFLVNEGWDCRFGDARQCVLSRPVSDHFPILLDGGGLRRDLFPFKFENMWLKVEGFKDLLKSWWEGDNFSGFSSFILGEKLKVLKAKLKEWNKDIFGRVEYRKDLALEQVEFWDAKEKISRLSLEELEARKEAREEYNKWVLLEEITWRQKFKEVWLKEGDRNTGIVNAFRPLLSNLVDWHPSVSGMQYETLEHMDACALEMPFMEEEVFDALLGCNGDKAPGPDDFSMAFWQFTWDFVKVDVMSFFREFYENDKFVKSLNATFMVLIPKKYGAEDLGDFRPISLVGSLYKWLAKVLANRLKKVVGKVVSKAQGAFVEGRQILDAVLIANETIDSALKNNENDILCKLDIEKAYDNVEWSFLFTVLQKMGFGGKWIKWCISTTSFFVLVNGTPTSFFQSSRSLRQGDPCSPYLFVIAMEVFSSLLKRAVDGGFLGCRVKGRSEEGVLISLLLFADDTLVFYKASRDHLTYLSWLLMWFEAVSGLVGSLPSTYLGMPLGAPFKSVTVWDGVEELFRRRLAMWKRQYLSKGGRATLIRSTLSNLPIYLMSLLCLPSSVRRRIEKTQRDFFWGGGNLEREPHLVRWELVCLSKKKGGLGVKCLSILNKALLAEWNWRFANEKEVLWNQVIGGKYGEDRGGWCSREVREAHGMGLWKGIRMDWELVGDRMLFIVGNWWRVRFWRDRWCRESSLCVSFPSLFAFTVDKEAWVADFWDLLAEGGWNPCFSRAFNDWEVEEAERFLERLHGKRVLEDVDDNMSCCIWNVNVQPKISFFAWEATWGKVLTLDMVQKRGRTLANRCFMCLEKEETIDRPSSPTLFKNKGFMGFTIYFIWGVLDVAFFS
ncbi:Transposon TX1 uncharacterized 149 kDa protein [Vitis vinifera]|uniref:Transposon TX1 uncharacterized 149 kDa protein n=1 Tax=Vitis vinifera TaxID=29760 RepID=A0A438C2J6_VITVI|nr:Transposon TX1 uncharacterized 149 kDa protein [Vitis vinifera]